MHILATDQAVLHDSLAAAVATLRAGGLVAFPTETVYGLGADARNESAIRRIFSAKGRPTTHPLIVHLAAIDQLSEWVLDLPRSAQRVAERFWPGPLTMILRKSQLASPLLSGGASTLGIRIPSHPVAAALLRAFGGGIAAPSANRFTRISPTSAADVAEELGEAVELILDGGRCPVGIESTIVDFSQSPPVLLRPGAVSLEALSVAAGEQVTTINRAGTASPGQHHTHYAPRARVVASTPNNLAEIVSQVRGSGRRLVVLAWQPQPPEHRSVEWWLWPDDLEQTARELYARLREVDRQGFEVAVIELPPDEGLGAALADRLRRAAGELFEGTGLAL